MNATALVRGVPNTFDRALVSGPRTKIDVLLARAQHETYQRHLTRAGYAVEQVPSSDDYPDCVFIEDVAVVIGSKAVITRPGAPSRRGEVPAVAGALADRFDLTHIEEPGAMDGGDVFVLNRTVYVGLSSRTNREGLEQLAEVAREQALDLVPVEVSEVLHLKSAVLAIDDETVVVTPNTVDETSLAGLHILYEDETERHGFSALPMRNGSVLVTANTPRTAARVSAAGFEVKHLDVSEILAADGGLTCMSILFGE